MRNKKLNPAPTDPIQAKIFAFFPLFFNNNISPFSFRASCLLDSQQHLNDSSTVGNNEKTKVKTN